ARAARCDEHRSRGDAGQQELEPAHFIAAALRRGPVFALEAEPRHAERACQRGRRLERRGPRAKATGRDRRAYLLTEQRRIRHLDPDPEDADAGCHRLHPPRRARRPQVRGRPARGPASLPAARRRILQDPRQGAGGDRRGPGRAQQARVSYIRTPAELADAVATLRREPLVAADTEAASFHRYRDRIYLVQLSSPTLTAIIDPLAIADLSPVGGLLDDPQVEKIFHDADYDLRILDRDYGFRARRLFDTRIAAQLAGEPAVGLAALLEKYVGVKLAKEHQKADWSRRPLPPAMLAYAAADTQHLPALREALRSRLAALRRGARRNRPSSRHARGATRPRSAGRRAPGHGTRRGGPAARGAHPPTTARRERRGARRASQGRPQPRRPGARPRPRRDVRPLDPRGRGARPAPPKRPRRARRNPRAPAVADRRAGGRAA